MPVLAATMMGILSLGAQSIRSGESVNACALDAAVRPTYGLPANRPCAATGVRADIMLVENFR